MKGAARLRLLVVAALLAAAAFALMRRPAPPVAFVGGPVLTVDASDRVAEGLAVAGGRVAAVGDRASIEEWARANGARVVDLGGRAVVPGFVDAHSHFPASGLLDPLVSLACPPLGPVKDMESLVATFAARAADSRRGPWIVAWNYDDTALADARHPTRTDLDRVSSTEPVVAFHVSMHVASVNTRGLEELGIGDATPDPEGGRIRRDADGHADGVLEEEAMRAVLVATMKPSTLEALGATLDAARSYLAVGVTTAQNGAAQADHMAALVPLANWGLLPLRLVVWPEGEAALALADGRTKAPQADPERVVVGAAKFVADGSIQARTAWLALPYHRPEGTPEAGSPRIAPDKLADMVARVHATGRQVAVHGNGDATIDAILDAFEEAQRRHPREDARPIIVHAQMAREDQLDRMKALGAVPSFFELHTWYWGDRHRERFLGPERAARISPLASAAARGIRFTLHADTPVVPMEPMRMLAAAVTRRTSSGQVLGDDQRIDAARALRALTIDAAWQLFLEDSRGSLEAGKLADFAILDRSPLAGGDLETIRVLETWVGGRAQYLAEGD